MKSNFIFFFLFILSIKIEAQTISVNYSPVIEGIDQKYGRVIWLSNGQDLNYIGSQGLSIKNATTVTEVKSDMTIGNKTAFGLIGINDAGFTRLWNIKNIAIGFSAYTSIYSGGDDMTFKSIQLNNKGELEKEVEEIGLYPSAAFGATAIQLQAPMAITHFIITSRDL